MRTKGPVIASIIALSLLVVSSSSVLAQLTVPEQRDYETELRDGFGDSILAVTPVLDAPFSGEALTAWHPRPNSGRSEMRATARYYRDRAGRVRVEQMFIGHAGGHSPQRVIVAPDPNSLPVYVLDPVARTARKIPRMYALMTVGGPNSLVMPISLTCVVGFSRPQRIHSWLERSGQDGLVIDQDSLGQRTMVGVQVAGTRFATTLPVGVSYGRGREIPVAYERWVSSELKLEVYGRSEDPEIGAVEHRLTTISRAEPPAELFEVPTDYEMTADYEGRATRWLNAYVPEFWSTLSGAREHCVRPWGR